MLAWLPLVLALSAQAEEPLAPPELEKVRPWATDFVDPAGLTRFHLVTRTAFTSAVNAWSYEARGHIRLTRGVALTAVLPVGLTAGRENVDAYGFVGNIALGLTVGGALLEGPGPYLRMAGGFDVYAPSSPVDEATYGERSTVAALRAYEPQLYLSRTLSFRGRVLVELDLEPVTFAAELGLVPALAIGGDRDGFGLLMSGAGRVAARLGTVFEPYLEVGATTQIAGDGEIAPPLVLTPGFRLHLAEAFSPALFVSVNFVVPEAVIIGLDLAAVVRPGPERKTRARERDNFFD